MLRDWQYVRGKSSRDLRIDWLRGLAMTCVIINHSKLSSLLSWFSYERFWVVTSAEVFVVLSGVVLGMVYGRRLARDGWRAVDARGTVGVRNHRTVRVARRRGHPVSADPPSRRLACAAGRELGALSLVPRRSACHHDVRFRDDVS